MPTNKNVLDHRELYIGGSEIGAILGISPFKKRWDLLLEKAQLKQDEFSGNKYTLYGEQLEPKIREYMNSQTNYDFREDTIVVNQPVISWRCNYDGLSKECNLEIKTTSIIHQHVGEYKLYLVQLLWGMILADVQYGYLAVYEREEKEDGSFNTEFDSSRLRIYRVDRQDYQATEKDILEQVKKFTDDLAMIKENPEIQESDLQNKNIVSLTKQLATLENQMSAYKTLKEQYDEIRNKLYEEMVKADVNSFKSNNLTITRYNPTSDTIVEVFDEETFKKEHEDLYNTYKKETVKKGKNGYVAIKVK